MAETRVRRADEGDIEPARLLTNRSWLATYPPLIGEETTRETIGERHSGERFRRQFDAPEGLFLVAEMDGTITGHCYAFRNEGFYIDRLHVDPQSKGAGIGRALLEKAEAGLASGERCWLDVLMGNDGAMRFYERVGYRKVGETDACGGLAGIPAAIY